jgi:hypothetical protein
MNSKDIRENIEHVHERERERERTKSIHALYSYTTVLKRTVKTHIIRASSSQFVKCVKFLWKISDLL